MIWNEKEIPWIRGVRMDNLRCLMGIRRMDKVANVRIRELCGVTRGMDERIDKGVLLWFSPLGRMKNERIAKTVYVGHGRDELIL